ncbi:MAG: MFS transporter [Anaerolineales bacterium]|nr:MFS transporter [Anaerolineales bacterium]
MRTNIKNNSLWQPLKRADFRSLCLGYTSFMLGSQCYYVALTWLLLEFTDSGALLGAVLMVGAVPRMVFMLVGGALVDHWSPLPIMRIASTVISMAVGVLTVLLWFDAVQTWHLFAIALIEGMNDAFFYPAATAIIPKMIDEEQLHSANALVSTGDQITQIAGPAIAALLIGWTGLSGTFAINTGLFAVGVVLLWFMRTRPLNGSALGMNSNNMFGSIIEGLRYAWRNPVIRACLVIIAILNFALVGPLTVGTAALAKAKLGGEAAYGSLMVALGVGSLVGTLGAGSLGNRLHPGRLLIGLSLVLAITVSILGFTDSLIIVMLTLLVMGFGIGFVSVVAIVWLQRQTPLDMQGRLMSVTMFAEVIFDPFSQGLTGLMLDVGLPPLFLSAGAIMLITSIFALFSSLARSE